MPGSLCTSISIARSLAMVRPIRVNHMNKRSHWIGGTVIITMTRKTECKTCLNIAFMDEDTILFQDLLSRLWYIKRATFHITESTTICITAHFIQFLTHSPKHVIARGCGSKIIHHVKRRMSHVMDMKYTYVSLSAYKSAGKPAMLRLAKIRIRLGGANGSFCTLSNRSVYNGWVNASTCHIIHQRHGRSSMVVDQHTVFKWLITPIALSVDRPEKCLNVAFVVVEAYCSCNYSKFNGTCGIVFISKFTFLLLLLIPRSFLATATAPKAFVAIFCLEVSW